jgi:cell division protein ZapA (FtsZ GTPase activity inhibitor)
MRIEVLGTSFILQTDQDPEYLQDIVDYLETKIQEIRGSVATQDSLKIAILSCIVVIDELFRERDAREYETGERKLEGLAGGNVTGEDSISGSGAGDDTEITTITQKLIAAIDEALGTHETPPAPDH